MGQEWPFEQSGQNPGTRPPLTRRERLEMIRQDCKDDAAALDGLPLTGATMGRVLGEHLAIMDALAASMLKQEDRLDAIDATLDRAEAAAIRRDVDPGLEPPYPLEVQP